MIITKQHTKATNQLLRLFYKCLELDIKLKISISECGIEIINTENNCKNIISSYAKVRATNLYFDKWFSGKFDQTYTLYINAMRELIRKKKAKMKAIEKINKELNI